VRIKKAPVSRNPSRLNSASTNKKCDHFASRRADHFRHEGRHRYKLLLVVSRNVTWEEATVGFEPVPHKLRPIHDNNACLG
jgi:hypothetical protein